MLASRIHQWAIVAACLVLLSGVSAHGAPAPAGEVADEAQFYFDRGSDFYQRGEFSEALAAYYASNRLVANRNVQFNIARCLEKLGHYTEAFRAWSALGDQKTTADERLRIDAAIESLRPNLGLWRIESDPPGATIYVDRHDLGSLGVTPKQLALPEGSATVILERDGYRPVTVKADIKKGREAVLRASLEQIHGELDLRRLPPDAEVRRDLIDGLRLRTGPGPVQLEPGRVVLFAAAPGFETARIEVDVKADQVVLVDIPLSRRTPPSGALVVQANVTGALVRVDGREMGFTPVVVESVPVGRRKVEVVSEGREPYRADVVVKNGDRSYLDVRLQRLDPEISAATKSAVRTEQAPASISVVTADQIAAHGWTTLAEALAGVRGAYMSNDRVYESVGFRGFSPPGDYTNRVLVMVDGHPMNDVLVGQGFVGRDLDVDLDNVARIEIVRGPGSVLYGTGALFGVINVVTRTAAPGPHGEAVVRGGTLGLASGRATLSARGRTAEVRISAAAVEQVGDRRYDWTDPGSGLAPMVSLGADGERASHADLAARVGVVTLHAGVNQREKEVPTGAFSTFAGPGTTYRDRRVYADLGADVSVGGFTLSGRAAFDETRFDGIYLLNANGGGTEDFKETLTARWLTGELRLVAPDLARQQVTVGAEVQSQFLLDLGATSFADQRAAGADDELVLSGYLVDDVRLGERAHLNLGVRVDRYANSFGTTLNPRLGLIVQPYRSGNTKLLVGRAFRAPSTYERFYNDDSITQKPAGDLDPELIVSAELEHTHHVNDDLLVVAAIFANQVDDLIVLASDPSDNRLVFQNMTAQVRGVGGEGELRYDPGTGSHVAIACTMQRIRSYLNDGSSVFTNAPTQLVSLRTIHPLIPVVARLGNELVYDIGRRDRYGRRLEDAPIWNVTVSGDLRGTGLRYFAGIFNVLDVSNHASGFPVGAEVSTATASRHGRSARVGLAGRF